MKVYLVMHKGSPQEYKTEAWVDVDKVGKNGVHVKSVKAFLKKKYAKEWIEERGYDHLIVKAAEICEK